MKKLILSRGPQIDIQKCTKIVGGNKFSLVLVAAQRSRDLRRQNPNTQHNFAVDALLDLQAESLNTEELLEKRISHQPTKKIDKTRAKKAK